MSNPLTPASYAEIHLDALKHNLLQVRAQVGDCPILAVVKANAYGHGAVRISQFLEKCKAKVAMFGVAFLEEGIALRESGITTPILVLTGLPINQISHYISYDLRPVVYDLDTLAALNREALKSEKKVKIHLKVDTGMGRIGISPGAVLPFFEKALTFDMIAIEGILTHFAEADLQDLSFAQQQLSSIQEVVSRLEQKGMTPPFCHMANSAAILHFKPAHLNLVRPGLMLYGYSPLQGKTSIALKPVVQIKARVLALKKVSKGTPLSYGRTFTTNRESLIATIGIGYADGYPFSLSNCGKMIAKETLVPVVGRVCMDMTLLDVTETKGLSVGDYVTVLGAENGLSMWADTLAQYANTHPYEILCGIGERVQRQYLNG